MGKIRYYCEYCDRSFLDDLQARKKHLSGTQHNRMRTQYYLPFRSLKEVYEVEKGKEPCRKFMQYNSCAFGDSCRYSHYSPADLQRLHQQAEGEKSANPQMVQQALSQMASPEQVNTWLDVWKTKQAAAALKPSKPAVQAVSRAWQIDYPQRLREYSELPPSLQPWGKFDLQNVHLDDWG